MKTRLSFLAAICVCSLQPLFAGLNGDSIRINGECRYAKFQRLAQEEFEKTVTVQAGIPQQTILVRKKGFFLKTRTRRSSGASKRFHESRASRCFKM